MWHFFDTPPNWQIQKEPKFQPPRKYINFWKKSKIFLGVSKHVPKTPSREFWPKIFFFISTKCKFLPRAPLNHLFEIFDAHIDKIWQGPFTESDFHFSLNRNSYRSRNYIFPGITLLCGSRMKQKFVFIHSVKFLYLAFRKYRKEIDFLF